MLLCLFSIILGTLWQCVILPAASARQNEPASWLSAAEATEPRRAARPMQTEFG